MSDEETSKELRALVALVSDLAANHKQVLKVHDENLQAAHRTVSNHAEAITDLRRLFHELGEQVVQQNQIIDGLQQSMIKVLRAMSLDDSLEPKNPAPN